VGKLPANIPLMLRCNHLVVGLGDVVVPGIAVTFASRIDFIRAFKSIKPDSEDQINLKLKKRTNHLKNFSLLGYAAGLLMSMAVNRVTGQAQPALVYILPLTLASIILGEKIRRGRFPCWNWEEDQELGLK
jgi:hypothetical protein